MIRFQQSVKVLFCLVAAVTLGSGCGGSSASERSGPDLLNVSYDPTRELWRDLNRQFIQRLRTETRTEVSIKQSHAGSSSQARAVIDGLEADVVTLALWTDIEAIHKKGLIKDGWQERLPNHSLAYFSTIVFVVRKGNPKGIKDWPDIVKPNVAVITPNPKTSGNGKLSFLAAWGSVIQAGGTEKQARDFVTRLYRQTPVLETGARGATTTFAQRGIGDVHLTWENEAHLEVEEAGGALEIVYPPQSIRAEPYVSLCRFDRGSEGNPFACREVPAVLVHRGGAGHGRETFLSPHESSDPCQAQGQLPANCSFPNYRNRYELGGGGTEVLRRRRHL